MSDANRMRPGLAVATLCVGSFVHDLPSAHAQEVRVAGRDAWQAGTRPEIYFDNCRASIDEARAALRSMTFQDVDYRLIKGWFSSSVPDLARELTDRRICLLRLDGDWYDSTKICLDWLFPLVVEGGVVVVDDYCAWDGCARAMHEYLGQHGLAFRLRTLPGFAGACIYKKPRLSFDD